MIEQDQQNHARPTGRLEERRWKRSNKRRREKGVYCQVEIGVLIRSSVMIDLEGGGSLNYQGPHSSGLTNDYKS